MHKDKPFKFNADNEEYRVDYVPGESNTFMFGGNSNWRGPIWLCSEYRIHSNKCPEHLDKSFCYLFQYLLQGSTPKFMIVAIFRLYWTQYVSFMNRSGQVVDYFMLYIFKIWWVVIKTNIVYFIPLTSYILKVLPTISYFKFTFLSTLADIFVFRDPSYVLTYPAEMTYLVQESQIFEVLINFLLGIYSFRRVFLEINLINLDI